MQDRMERFAAALPQEVDGALVLSSHNRRYLTGFASSAGILFVTRSGAWLLIDSRYKEAAAAQVKNCEVLLLEKASTQLRELVQKTQVHILGVEGASISVTEYQRYQEMLSPVKLQFGASVSVLLEELRSQKDAFELQKIREAQRLTDETFSHILSHIRPGVTERELALTMEFYLRRQGADGPAFDFIVVSGKNSSLPHGVPGYKELEHGDFVTMDFGAVVDGYCSDMTRTVAVGCAGEEHRRLYDTVLAAQKAAIEAMTPGAKCRKVDEAARSLIDAAGYKGCFGHGLGHGLGLEIHELPSCSPASQAVLKPGMLMTAEPGIYLEGRFGCRIEDLLVVTEDGVENLTQSPKELLVL